ncbi:MAG: hypothetical protein JWP35_4205 [Caulobacter sp.]|nr:hypothetical protein [Caulobacter sp.]
MTAALVEADQRAARVATELKGFREQDQLLRRAGNLYRYLISYRLTESVSPAHGPRAERYENLTALLKALKPVEKHIATSTYLVECGYATARTLLTELIRPLDAERDFLSVAQISKDSPAVFGKTNLTT